MMRTFTTILISTLLIAGSGLARSDQQIAPAADRQIDAAVGALGKYYGLYSSSMNADSSGAAFDAALKSLAVAVDPAAAKWASANESSSLRAKLVAIAVELRDHPAIVREIESRYVHLKGADLLPRALTAPSVLDRHATAPYRLAWEYLLLRPDMRRGPDRLDVPDDYRSRAIEALQRIGSDESPLVAVEAMRISTGPKVTAREVGNWQRGLLAMLSGFRSQSGLRALLEAAALADSQQSLEADPAYRWDPVEYAGRCVFTDSPESMVQAWRDVIASCPVDRLTPRQRAVLERLRARG